MSSQPKPKSKAKKQKLSPRQMEMVEDLRQALREVELHRQGKIKLQTLQECLAKLESETSVD